MESGTPSEPGGMSTTVPASPSGAHVTCLEQSSACYEKKKKWKQRWLLVFKKINQNTQDIKNDAFQTLSLRGRKLSTAIFNSDIQLSVYSFSCFISVCPFVALLKATYAKNLRIVFV